MPDLDIHLGGFNDPPENLRVQVAFSGGRTSGYMLHQLLEAHNGLPSNMEVIFTNTGREMPETLDFIQECSQRWSVPITWLEFRVTCIKGVNKQSFVEVNHNSASRNGEPFMELIRFRKFLPNVVARFCTAEMKIRTALRYLREKNWPVHHATCLGIRFDEARRIKPSTEGQCNWYPLAHTQTTKEDIAAFWKSAPFDLRLPNHNGKCWLGNCDGCFLKSEHSLGLLYKHYPERYQWWIDAENLVTELSGSRATIEGAKFRKQAGYQEMADFIDRQGELAFNTYDGEGALCQADEGECTG